MTFLLIGVVVNVAQIRDLIFFFFDKLGGINPGGWTISSLVSMTFFELLGLRLISSRRGPGLRLFPIVGGVITVLLLNVLLVLLGQWMMPFRAYGIDLLKVKGEL